VNPSDPDSGVRADADSADELMIAAARRAAAAALQAAATSSTAPQLPPGAGAPSGRSGSFLPGSFAGYDVLREIHHGGQGVVYQALQRSTRRKVAIKVMRDGPFASPAEQARFEREIQVLGQLNHPSIVAIHDSGQVGGCQYFVMDYVSGQPLDVWIASGRHSIATILRVFGQICVAVNAAHLRGIIHRDLKPGNIRVDEQGAPHVLDFGLAKVALPGAASDAAAMTLTGQFVGSLPWASPEQAEGVPGKLDLRTDVYSLGVILYQMLTGKFPYDVVGNMRDVLDRIIRVEPQRPSTIWPAIDDEVETIVLKCLAKQRERRYQSAGELARDIARYLAGEPIEAKRDSTPYLVRKYLRKYRLPAAISAAFLMIIVVGLIGSLTFWRQATIARTQAEERRTAAQTSQEKAEAEARRADTEAARAREQAAVAQSVNQLLNDMLARANRGREHGNPNITVREVMDAAARELETGASRYEPQVEAALHATLGQTYRALGLFEKAKAHLEAALTQAEALYGRESLAVADMLESLCLLRMDSSRNRFANARELAEESLATRRRLLGSEHPAVATALHNLGTLLSEEPLTARSYLTEALAMRRRLLGDASLEVAETMVSLGRVSIVAGEWDTAEQLLRDALALRRGLLQEDDVEIAINLNELGDLLAYRGDAALAEPVYRDALALFRKFLGNEHPLVGMAANHLGIICRKLGALDEAEPLLREGLEIRRRFAADDPQLGYSARNLALLLSDRAEYAAAEPLFREAIAVFDRHGYNSADDCVARVGLGSALLHLGRYAEAGRVLRDADARLAALPESPNAAVRASASVPALRGQIAAMLADLDERGSATPE
jgi:eukaryotic-like serine/threonine-protein kinase